jgi:hypothetical protein
LWNGGIGIDWGLCIEHILQRRIDNGHIFRRQPRRCSHDATQAGDFCLGFLGFTLFFVASIESLRVVTIGQCNIGFTISHANAPFSCFVTKLCNGADLETEVGLFQTVGPDVLFSQRINNASIREYSEWKTGCSDEIRRQYKWRARCVVQRCELTTERYQRRHCN